MAETWAALFDRATGRTTLPEIRTTLAKQRESVTDRRESDDEAGHDSSAREQQASNEAGPTHEADGPDPARVVADADVLVADLLVGDDARDALDHVRRHSWIGVVASDPLLDDARAVIESLGSDALAEDWDERVADWRVSVTHPTGDHPALASAHQGAAAHVLSFDERLRSADAGVRLRARTPISVKHPRAFATLFDPESLHETVVGGAYPGPDRNPRA